MIKLEQTQTNIRRYPNDPFNRNFFKIITRPRF